MVTDGGHELVGLAADRDTAIALLSSTTVHLALVYVHLADCWTGVEVARAAAGNSVAAVFTTANPRLLPADLAGVRGVIAKPYSPSGMKVALRYLSALLSDRANGERRPASSCLRRGRPEQSRRPDVLMRETAVCERPPSSEGFENQSFQGLSIASLPP